MVNLFAVIIISIIILGLIVVVIEDNAYLSCTAN